MNHVWSASKIEDNLWEVRHGRRWWTAHKDDGGSWHIRNEQLRGVAPNGRLAKNILKVIDNLEKSSQDLTSRIADRLRTVHFDGNGCGTHGPNACSNCYGPSPMSADEVAREVAAVVADHNLGMTNE